MATEVIMPKLGLTMEQGTLGSWLAEEGQEVKKGDPLLEVVTDKLTMEVEAQKSGVLRKILVQAGTEVPVFTLVGIIGRADEDISSLMEGQGAPEAQAAVAAPEQQAPAAAAVAVAEPPTLESANGRDGKRQPHRASPKARKMAAELGIDLSRVAGSGPGGRIVSADIAGAEVAAPASVPVVSSAPSMGAGETVELTRAQQVTGERLTASYQQIPHIHIGMHVSAVWLKQFRDGYAIEGKKISYNDLIVKATGKALVEFPRLNSVLEGKQVRQMAEVNVGFAADTPKGLLVPVVKGVAAKSVEEIAAETVRLVDGARTGTLKPDDMGGGTFTISNLGMYGVSQFTAIINPPQVAILAIGAIEQRVVALPNGALTAQLQLTLNLAADHRVVDGALAARFLRRLKEILETPGLLG
jgi:pyruvate dehydrogenase E2 component (dihydrolipoamide acetyltransferase)